MAIPKNKPASKNVPSHWLPAVFDEDTRKPLAAKNGNERESCMAMVTYPSGKQVLRQINGTESQWESADMDYIAVEHDAEGTIYLKPAVMSTAIREGDDEYDELASIARESVSRPATKD